MRADLGSLVQQSQTTKFFDGNEYEMNTIFEAEESQEVQYLTCTESKLFSKIVLQSA